MLHPDQAAILTQAEYTQWKFQDTDFKSYYLLCYFTTAWLVVSFPTVVAVTFVHRKILTICGREYVDAPSLTTPLVEKVADTTRYHRMEDAEGTGSTEGVDAEGADTVTKAPDEVRTKSGYSIAQHRHHVNAALASCPTFTWNHYIRHAAILGVLQFSSTYTW